jgi:hypothetical protein
MSDAIPSVDELKRRILFVPLDNKPALHRWIMEFLHLDIPDTIVDPSSNSTPMDLIWEVYDAARTNKRVDFNRCLGFASRDSFKTLGAAVLEVLAVVHLQRNVAHMAAIESQAKKAQSYVKAFFAKPFLRDYIVGDNDRKKEIARYHDPKTGENLNQKQFLALSIVDKLKYQEVSNYITIVICTPRGANSEHVPFFVVDEVDLASPVAYEEAKMIPAPIGDQMPITLLTSTRKYSFGLVQKEIDDSAETGLHIRHWNIIDVTERCPTSRHQPELPKQEVYYSDETLSTITKEHYNGLTADQQNLYEPDTAYAGCVKNCKLFAMCRGRLATMQKEADPNAKVRSLLKPVAHTQSLFKNIDPAVAKAQLLCRKPSTAGLIYPNFDRQVHMLTPAEMASKITGEDFPESFTKSQLIALLKTRDVRFAGGMDFGYTHNFSVVTGAIDGNRCFVFDVISVAEIELEQQIEICASKILDLNPKIAADSASPQSIKTFSKKGFRIKGVVKGPGSVTDGIGIVRTLLRPAVGDPRLFFLKADEGCELLAKRLSGYHWTLDAAGEPTDIPDDTNDDECDALRYLMMSNFAKAGRVSAAKEPPAKPTSVSTSPQYTPMWMAQQVQAQTGASNTQESSDLGSARGKKGSFMWDLG